MQVRRLLHQPLERLTRRKTMPDRIAENTREGIDAAIADFTVHMRHKLLLNRNQDHWSGTSPAFLLMRAKGEMAELELAFTAPVSRQAIVRECADVAALCMMIADNVQWHEVDKVGPDDLGALTPDAELERIAADAREKLDAAAVKVEKSCATCEGGVPCKLATTEIELCLCGGHAEWSLRKEPAAIMMSNAEGARTCATCKLRNPALDDEIVMVAAEDACRTLDKRSTRGCQANDYPHWKPDDAALEEPVSDGQWYTFDEFLAYGEKSGIGIETKVPWSFEFHGHAVTHENDDCYIVPVGSEGADWRFERGETIHVSPHNVLSVEALKPEEPKSRVALPDMRFTFDEFVARIASQSEDPDTAPLRPLFYEHRIKRGLDGCFFVPTVLGFRPFAQGDTLVVKELAEGGKSLNVARSSDHNIADNALGASERRDS
jgi:hypothetical protein